MRYGTVRSLVMVCLVVILGSLLLRSVAGPLCLSARSISGCQSCCQPETSSETEARGPSCSLFCCTGLPADLQASRPPDRIMAITLSSLRDASARLAPAPPPPKFSLFVPDRQS